MFYENLWYLPEAHWDNPVEIIVPKDNKEI